ncbi:MAG: hypothetical protein M0T80_12600 [Actinomycetota bacterium]|nr:hypothetical protein [Actinomycetota bacterium]
MSRQDFMHMSRPRSMGTVVRADEEERSPPRHETLDFDGHVRDVCTHVVQLFGEEIEKSPGHGLGERSRDEVDGNPDALDVRI